MTPQERDFGQASIEQADAEERRKARQRRLITRASIAAAMVLACFAVVAGWQWRIANVAKVEDERQTRQAKFERDKAHIQLLAMQAHREATDITSADAIERADALALASIAKSTGPPEADAIEAARARSASYR